MIEGFVEVYRNLWHSREFGSLLGTVSMMMIGFGLMILVAYIIGKCKKP